MQTSNCKATDAEKASSQGEKLLNAIFKIKAQVLWKMFLSHEMKVICNAEDRYHVLVSSKDGLSCG